MFAVFWSAWDAGPACSGCRPRRRSRDVRVVAAARGRGVGGVPGPARRRGGATFGGSLYALVRRHAESVPYETLWIESGEMWGIDPGESVQRIALVGRGGYCYHLNGALGLLLHSLRRTGTRRRGQPSGLDGRWTAEHLESGRRLVCRRRLGRRPPRGAPTCSRDLCPGPVPDRAGARRQHRVAPHPRPGGRVHRHELDHRPRSAG